MNNVTRFWAENPYYVLALPCTATMMEVTRAAQKWQALLQAGAASARTYRTPFGECERSVEGVRAALAALQDPEQRTRHAILAQLPADSTLPNPFEFAAGDRAGDTRA